MSSRGNIVPSSVRVPRGCRRPGLPLHYGAWRLREEPQGANQTHKTHTKHTLWHTARWSSQRGVFLLPNRVGVRVRLQITDYRSMHIFQHMYLNQSSTLHTRVVRQWALFFFADSTVVWTKYMPERRIVDHRQHIFLHTSIVIIDWLAHGQSKKTDTQTKHTARDTARWRGQRGVYSPNVVGVRIRLQSIIVRICIFNI